MIDDFPDKKNKLDKTKLDKTNKLFYKGGKVLVFISIFQCSVTQNYFITLILSSNFG